MFMSCSLPYFYRRRVTSWIYTTSKDLEVSSTNPKNSLAIYHSSFSFWSHLYTLQETRYWIPKLIRGFLRVRQCYFHNDPQNFIGVDGGILGCRGFQTIFKPLKLLCV